jgi:predicted ATPase
LRLTRLKLQNWRNFKDIDIELEDRAFFVGPNASGKSNLLDAFRFLRDLASPIGGGFQQAVLSRGGVGEIRSFAATRNANVSIEATLGDDEVPNRWSYVIQFGAGKDASSPCVVREVVRCLGAETPLVARPDAQDVGDPMLLTETHLEQVSANREFRAIAEFFGSIQYLNIVPQMVREPERSLGAGEQYGADLISRINATTARTRDARLKRMQAALQIAVPQLSGLELEIDTRGTPHLRAKYKHWRPAGAWQREDRFSDGTLRLLALVWSLQEKGGPLLLEEPEISLNGAIVRRLAPIMARSQQRSGRQVLVTTHSAALLNENVSRFELHLLQPTDQGTQIRAGATLPDIQALVEAGVPLGEAIMPKVDIPNADQLTFLDLLGH